MTKTTAVRCCTPEIAIVKTREAFSCERKASPEGIDLFSSLLRRFRAIQGLGSSQQNKDAHESEHAAICRRVR